MKRMIRACALCALVVISSGVGTLSAQRAQPPVVGARVCFVHEPAAISEEGIVREEVVRSMVDGLLAALTGRRDATDAWRTLLHPEEVVGIKVSAAGGPQCGTRLATILAVVGGLKKAGFGREQILVWDKNREDLLSLGLSERHPDYRLAWIDPKTGYDPESPVSAPVLGRLIWGDGKFSDAASLRFSDMVGGTQQHSSQSYFAKLLTRTVTRVVHLPALQDSYFCGVQGAFAGMVLGNLDNWRRFVKPPVFGDPFLAEIYANPAISSKVLLTLLDGLALQYAGGPFANPAHTLRNAMLFASYDPVAIDATARRMIDEARVGARLPSVKPMSGFVETAEAMGLGVAEESRIQLVRVPRAR